MTRFLAGIAAALLALALIGLGYLYSGAYSVAATEPHNSVTSWLLHTAMQRSVRERARSVRQLPAGKQSADPIEAYIDMCVQCHGAPGKEPGIIGKGLNPPAPPLDRAARQWSRAELFWIVKNGVRMTGMPAFGPTHSDEQLWPLVEFVERLGTTSAKQYEELERKWRAKRKQSGASGPGHRH